jgi:hypothetical protein
MDALFFLTTDNCKLTTANCFSAATNPLGGGRQDQRTKMVCATQRERYNSRRVITNNKEGTP